MAAHWEHYPHPADMGVRGFGSTRAEAFAQAALAMTAIVTDLRIIEPRECVVISCQEPDDDSLLFSWLNAILYEMATRRMLFGRYDVTIEGDLLHAQAWGEIVNVQKHQPAVEVKAATYTDIRVCQRKDSTWVAQCIVDV